MKPLSDIEIAQKTQLQPVVEIAQKLGIKEDDLELYGKYKAKLPLDLIDEEKIKKNNLVLVTAVMSTSYLLYGSGYGYSYRYPRSRRRWCSRRLR